jgi:hypothetical protein
MEHEHFGIGSHNPDDAGLRDAAHNAAAITDALRYGRAIVGLFDRYSEHLVGEVVICEQSDVTHAISQMTLVNQDSIIMSGSRLGVRNPSEVKLQQLLQEQQRILRPEKRKSWL